MKPQHLAVLRSVLAHCSEEKESTVFSQTQVLLVQAVFSELKGCFWSAVWGYMWSPVLLSRVLEVHLALMSNKSTCWGLRPHSFDDMMMKRRKKCVGV